MQRQTTSVKPQEVQRKWFLVDATGQNLGRLASEIAQILTGKRKATYTPNVDCGDYVIVVNAKDVNLTGNKEETKKYYNVSGYLGGLRVRDAKTMKQRYPREMIERAVWGMLPKGSLGRKMYGKLFVYADANHQHQAQNPQTITFK